MADESEEFTGAPRVASARPFVLAPFRGLRFDPDTVGDLGTVISPPYDVLDAETVRTLEAANRRNIVRLILSRRFERPYLAVRDRLQSWREKSYLRADSEPALYLYEYTADQTTVRGLIGLAGLRGEEERVILPHEDVMPGPVDDRAVLMRTTQTNLEPILLVHRGSDRYRAQVQSMTDRPPTVEFTALDGSNHRLWAVTSASALEAVAEELAASQVLIADGHHRYAAYLRLQAELRDPDAPQDSSPWDYGLAILVDQCDRSLRVGPIHRSVTALTLTDVRDQCEARGDGFAEYDDREDAFAAQAEAARDKAIAAFVVSDGHSWAVLSTPRTHAIDAAVLHSTLLPAWQIADEQVGYHHHIDQAMSTANRQPGVVIAVHPPSLGQVMACAAQGVRMPRKATSFAPKPRMGVVMRDIRDS